MGFGNTVQVKTSRYLTKITALQTEAFATIAIYSWWQLGEVNVCRIQNLRKGGITSCKVENDNDSAACLFSVFIDSAEGGAG